MEFLISVALPILLFVVAVIGAIWIYSYIDLKLCQRALDAVGIKWCADNEKEFVKVEMWKNHMALIYKDSGKKMRRKFIAHFGVFTWKIKRVEWLEK